MENKILTYIKESRDELKKVVWPSRPETIKYTLLVIGISVFTALFLGSLDFVLNIAVEELFTSI